MAGTGQNVVARDPERDRLRLWIKLFDTTHMIEREVRSRLRARFACTLPQIDVMSMLVRTQDGITMVPHHVSGNDHTGARHREEDRPERM